MNTRNGDKPIIRLTDITEDAQFSFWEQVVKHLPLADSGDFDPTSSCNFDLAIEEAIKIWWGYNASESYDLDIGNGEILTNDGEEFHCYDCNLDYSTDEEISKHTCGVTEDS